MTTIIIVTYNSAALIRGCLSSTSGFNTIVVDNASRDETTRIVRTAFPDVRLVARQTNGGFAVAVNEGLALVPRDDVLLINPDIVCRSGSIATLEDYLGAHPSIGIAVPHLLYPDGSTQESVRRFPDPLGLLARRMPLFARSRAGRAVLARFLLEGEGRSSPRPVDWAIGAAMLVRRAAIHDVGGMQEWMFLYGEDTDWCYRMWQKGWEVHLVPEAVMEHRYQRHSRSTLDFRSAATRHHWASLVKLFVLHPALLLGRGPRQARDAHRRWSRTARGSPA